MLYTGNYNNVNFTEKKEKKLKKNNNRKHVTAMFYDTSSPKQPLLIFSKSDIYGIVFLDDLRMKLE